MPMTTSFNPLEIFDEKVLFDVVKQRVRNIIRSYNHPADVLAEPIQNAVDELDEAVRSSAVDRGKLIVQIDCATGNVSVVDNGRGMTSEYVQRSLAPDVTGKAELFLNNRSRGHKGVGLTFLAYGFNFFELESKTDNEHYKVRIENARQWVENPSLREFPEATLTPLSDDEGRLRDTGTIVTIQVSDQTEPRNLHRSFPNSKYAKTVLESQTAAGVYPKNPSTKSDPTFDATLIYSTQDGQAEKIPLSSTYRFPHLDLARGHKVFDLGKYLANNPPVTPPARLQKKNDGVYRNYSTDALIGLVQNRLPEGDLLTSLQEVNSLLRRHQVTAYALAGSSAGYKDTLSKSWNVPRNRKLIAPSIRVATDSMISSWQRDLSLSHRGFNVERIWITVHFVGVEPDLGRKDYPPQILELLSILEEPLADDIAIQGNSFLIPSTRSGKPIDYEKPDLKASERRKHPFRLFSPPEFEDITYLTEPQEEQDVVALFNELRGLGILPFYKPVFFSGSYVYDSYLEYDPSAVPDVVTHALPGQPDLPNRIRSGVAEFKFGAKDLLPDLVRSIKYWSEITWIVCWTAKEGSFSQGGLTLHVTAADEGDSPYAAVTHLATLDSAGEQVIHIVALSTLLKILGES